LLPPSPMFHQAQTTFQSLSINPFFMLFVMLGKRKKWKKESSFQNRKYNAFIFFFFSKTTTTTKTNFE
jgi:hypothetical protein